MTVEHDLSLQKRVRLENIKEVFFIERAQANNILDIIKKIESQRPETARLRLSMNDESPLGAYMYLVKLRDDSYINIPLGQIKNFKYN